MYADYLSIVAESSDVLDADMLDLDAIVTAVVSFTKKQPLVRRPI